MFKNYLKTALRNLFKNKLFSLINIMGMAIGLSCFFIIMIFIINEFSYDGFHDKANRIVRAGTTGFIGDSPFNTAGSSSALADNLIKDFPEVIMATRISRTLQPILLSFENKVFYESDLMYVDSTFLEIFSFKVIRGSTKTLLTEPYSLVLTKSLAEKYFGNEDPINKILKMNNSKSYRIMAVVEDPPSQSHIQFKALASFATLYNENGAEYYTSNWGSLSFYTYLLLDNKDSNISLNAKMPKYINQFMEGATMDPILHPIRSLHLHSKMISEMGIRGSIDTINTLSAIAFFIILIACFNFMNLSTAKATRRAREVGIRKVVGARKHQIIIQFIFESVALSLISFFISIFIVVLLLPEVSTMVNQSLTSILGNNHTLIIIFLIIALLTGLLAGSYPAFYLSMFQPIKTIKGNTRENPGKQNFRSYLVILQYTISVILIISTAIVYKQLMFMKNTHLGYDSKNILVIPIRGEYLKEKVPVLKNELLSLSVVRNVSASMNVPGGRIPGMGFIPEGYEDKKSVMISFNYTDYDFVETMGMNIVIGRSFSREYSTDTSAAIINEALVKNLGWSEPIGKKIKTFTSTGEKELKVIGVLKDFHFRSLHNPIKPMILRIEPSSFSYISVRLNSGNVAKSIEAVRQKWEEIENSFPFDYFILDTSLENNYSQDSMLGKLFISFSLIAIFISCLGLFGLAIFIMEQRKKEISIRKVFGANFKSLVTKLVNQFLKWVLIANVLAFPIAWYFMNKWLQNFAYQTKIGIWIFLVAGFTALLIALLTVIFQTFKASRQSPIHALRFE